MLVYERRPLSTNFHIPIPCSGLILSLFVCPLFLESLAITNCSRSELSIMGSENVRFTDLLLEGAIISESCLLTCVSSYPSLTYLGVFWLKFVYFFVSDIIQLPTICNNCHTPNHHSNVELHLRPSAMLTWLIPYIEAIAAAEAAAVAAAAAGGGAAEAAGGKQQLPQQQRLQR